MRKLIEGNKLPVFRRSPVLRLLIPWMAGIQFVDLFPDCQLKFILSLALVGWLLHLCFFLLLRKMHTVRYNGYCILIYWFCCGALAALFQRNAEMKHPLPLGSMVHVRAIVKEVKRQSFGSRLFVQLQAMEEAGHWEPILAHVQLRADSSIDTDGWRAGDKLELAANFQVIHAPAAPYSYPLAKQLARKGIRYQAYLRKNFFTHLARDHFSLQNYFQEQSRKLERRLHQFIPGKEEASVACALLIGLDDEIEDNLIQAYAATGTLHVLSVSGMHVGVIYLLLAWLFSPLEKRPAFRHGYFLLIILFIWLYALLSGCSAAVIRAALMLTITQVGKWLRRDSELSNGVVISLLILLIWNPAYYFDMGLRLSYLAVIGIIWLQPLIASWFYFRNPILSWFWAFVAVSLGAQANTLFVSLYYFHQFPDLFLFTNLLIIPLSTISIYLSLLTSLSTPLPILATFFGNVDSRLIALTNGLARKFAELPNAFTSQIPYEAFGLVMGYLILYALVNWLRKRHFDSLWPLLLLILLVQIKSLVTVFQQMSTIHCYSYNYKRKAVVVCCSGRQVFFLAQDKDSSSIRKLNADMVNLQNATGLRSGAEAIIVRSRQVEKPICDGCLSP